MKLIHLALYYFGRRASAMAGFGFLLVLAGVNGYAGDSKSLSPTIAAAVGTNSRSTPAPSITQSEEMSNNVTASTNVPETNALTNGPALDDKYKLIVADRLSFRITEDGEDPKPIFVTDSGDIEVPYIGRVAAQGKTCRQLAAEVKTALEKDYYYHATVILAVDIMTKNHGRVYVTGEVRLPGPVDLPSDETFTLSKAILRSGGFSDYAKRDKVVVTRKDASGKDGKKTFTVDVGDIFDKGKIETDLPLQAEDLVFVPARLLRF
jgi:polysaccharide biosynthesis/export protein